MNKTTTEEMKGQLMLLTQQNKFPEAEKLAIQLTDINPKDMEVWFALGQIFQVQCKYEESAFSFYHACSKKSPLLERALDSYIKLCQHLARFEDGYDACKKLLRLKSSSASANYQLGYFAWELSYEAEAVMFLERGVRLDPMNSAYHLSWAEALVYLGEIHESLKFFDNAKKHNPEGDTPYIKSLFARNYSHELLETDNFKAHVEFGERLESRYANKQPFTKVQLNKKRRIAYLSKDFNQHAVAFFFLSIIQSHNRNEFEVICYSDSAKVDYMTEAIKTQCEHWVEVDSMANETLFKKIRDDEVEILIDLTGYATDKSRLGVFAMRAAPIQISYLGYPNTTGLTTIDYRITDECCDPVAQKDILYTEKLLRLKKGFLCYSPIDDSPDVSESPYLKTGGITFGSFNVFPKLNEETLQAWGTILCSVDKSKLFMKAKLFSDKTMRGKFIKRMAKYGVNSNQIIFSGNNPRMQDHLNEYAKVDIHLDAFPYNGTTTTCDALWMGVPSITLAGNVHRSRVGMSIMNQIGLSDFVAHSYDEYIKVAIDKATKADKLISLRSSMRERLKGSHLMDKVGFTLELESLYRSL